MAAQLRARLERTRRRWRLLTAAALPPDHWRIANAESVLGSALAALGRYEEAEPLLLASYPVVRDKSGAESVYTRDILERLVVLYDTWGRPEQAAEYRAQLVAAGGEP